MSEFNIEHIPYLGTNRCTRCGKTDVYIQIIRNQKFYEDTTMPDNTYDREMVNRDGTPHVCDILDIKDYTNFTLIE